MLLFYAGVKKSKTPTWQVNAQVGTWDIPASTSGGAVGASVGSGEVYSTRAEVIAWKKGSQPLGVSQRAKLVLPPPPWTPCLKEGANMFKPSRGPSLCLQMGPLVHWWTDVFGFGQGTNGGTNQNAGFQSL